MSRSTPMIQQYLQIKERYKDAILFFRMGDFYEMFFEDAHIASRILGIALTSRDRDKEKGIPMCGVPYHAASSYIAKLVECGHKVAVCEQVEDPGSARGIVKREVTRVITPGLVLDADNLSPDQNNYLLALCEGHGIYGFSFLDLSTGEFFVTEFGSPGEFISEVVRIHPREILVPETVKGSELLETLLASLGDVTANYVEDEAFELKAAVKRLTEHFRTHSLDGFGCKRFTAGIRSAGAILRYVEQTQMKRLAHIHALKPHRVGDYMVLDETTERNLELFESIFDRRRRGSLISVLDKTLSPMGARRLRRWMRYPLIDPARIEARLDAVSWLAQERSALSGLRGLLKGMHDIERLIGRVAAEVANARDLVCLKGSFRLIPQLRSLLASAESVLLRKIHDLLDPLEDITGLIEASISDEPPLGLREGGLIKPGWNAELDELVRICTDGRSYIAEMEARERTKTGIPSLRIGFNKVFGYYIEVTKTHSSSVPADYIRKQTLVNAERYINEELKRYESKVLGAEQRRFELEYRLFTEIRERIASQTQRIQQVADALAELDVLQSLAEVSIRQRYVRPRITDGDKIRIIGGRHPVVETIDTGEPFVPNDLELDGNGCQLMIITGPNMAGKSTYLRQAALIVLMAQMGSHVPAEEAEIAVVDRIFTRVGAQDNLAKGQSTFLVEMNETANILHNATERSLVILDEIGRGTSTFDGVSIAWAVAEYLHDSPSARPKTLFATHYHELTDLALTKERVKNYHIAVKEWNERMIFLRKVVEGPTSRSYGIQVARLAGLPEEVIHRAKEILANLQQGELTGMGTPKIAASRKGDRRPESWQMGLFGDRSELVAEELRRVDIARITPLEALNMLETMKKKLRQK